MNYYIIITCFLFLFLSLNIRYVQKYETILIFTKNYNKLKFFIFIFKNNKDKNTLPWALIYGGHLCLTTLNGEGNTK